MRKTVSDNKNEISIDYGDGIYMLGKVGNRFKSVELVVSNKAIYSTESNKHRRLNKLRGTPESSPQRLFVRR